jgi:hypothetical protein
MTVPNADSLSNQLLTRMVLRVPRPDDLACSRQQFNDSMSESSGCELSDHIVHSRTLPVCIGIFLTACTGLCGRRCWRSDCIDAK